MKNFFLFSVFIFLVSLSGCQFLSSEIPIQTSAQKNETLKKLEIVASFYPLAFFAEEIAGDKATIIDLAGNQEVHEFIPSPKDILVLQNADLVISQGEALEPWIEDIIPQLQKKNIPVLKILESLKLQKKEEYEEDEPHKGGYDPHIWLDPILAQEMVNVILKELIKINAKNANFYTKNAENLKKKFTNFDKEFKSLSCSRNKVIISHDSFGYLSKRYGFTFSPIAGISINDEPSAKLLAKLKEESEKGITHILTEENSIKRFAETLARETGLKMLPIYTLETDSESFFSGYEKNLKSIKTAFQCQ